MLVEMRTVAQATKVTELTGGIHLEGAKAISTRDSRQMSRRIVGSKGHAAAKTNAAELDRRAVHLRQDGWHKMTTWLVSTYSEVVIEDLDVAGMKRSMGKRAFRRSVSDAALGKCKPQLTYKMAKAGTSLVVADRWYGSSQIHHGCGCRLVSKAKMAKTLLCANTGESVDRDHNAAQNHRGWPEKDSSPGPVVPSAPVDTQARLLTGTDPGSEHELTHAPRSDCKTKGQPKADWERRESIPPKGKSLE